MRSIKIKNFKAFSDEILLKLDGENLLLCGENGSGKTSLYEAIQLGYCKSTMLSALSKPSTPSEERQQREKDFLDSYNCQKDKNTRFTLVINDDDFDSFNDGNVVPYFVSSSAIQWEDKICVVDLLHKMNLDQSQIPTIMMEWWGSVSDAVNTSLKKSFAENIRIELAQDGSNCCVIHDDGRDLHYSEDLSRYFNEAKLQLVSILIMLSFAQVGYMKNEGKKHLLVLDDVVSSLDMMNREMMIKYLLENFLDVQKIVLTHNVSYFNLFVFLQKNQNKEKWRTSNLYEVGGVHRIYEYDELTTELLNKQLKEGSITPLQAGNLLRQRFEQLLVELSRLHTANLNVDKLDTILMKLTNGEELYVKKLGSRIYYAQDLVKEILALLKSAPEDELKKKIEQCIYKYRIANKEFKPLIPVLKDLTIFQKIVMHQLSHGANTYPTFSVKEESIIFDLMIMLEEYVNKGRTMHSAGDVTSM